MVAPLRGTETLREAHGGKEEVGEGKLRNRRRRGGQDEEYAEKGAIEEVFTNLSREFMQTLFI